MRIGLLTQLCTLIDAKFVLLVNYDKTKVAKFYIILQQRHRTDDDIYFSAFYFR